MEQLCTTENEVSRLLVGIFLKVHRAMGPGLFESVYEEIICIELRKLGLQFERQKEVRAVYEGQMLSVGFRADLIVEDKVIVEIKSVSDLAHVHAKQVLTYLRLTGLKLGLLVNFNEKLIRDGIHRIVNGL